MAVTFNPEIPQISNKDYIPFVSTVRSLKILYDRCKAEAPAQTAQAAQTLDFRLLSSESNIRYVILLIPVVGNIIVAIHDLITTPLEMERFAHAKSKIAHQEQSIEYLRNRPLYLDRQANNIDKIQIGDIGGVCGVGPRALESINRHFWVRDQERQLQNIVRNELQRIYREWDAIAPQQPAVVAQ